MAGIPSVGTTPQVAVTEVAQMHFSDRPPCEGAVVVAMTSALALATFRIEHQGGAACAIKGETVLNQDDNSFGLFGLATVTPIRALDARSPPEAASPLSAWVAVNRACNLTMPSCTGHIHLEHLRCWPRCLGAVNACRHCDSAK